jgi:hypothetical protein
MLLQLLAVQFDLFPRERKTEQFNARLRWNMVFWKLEFSREKKSGKKKMLVLQLSNV